MKAKICGSQEVEVPKCLLDILKVEFDRWEKDSYEEFCSNLYNEELGFEKFVQDSLADDLLENILRDFLIESNNKLIDSDLAEFLTVAADVLYLRRCEISEFTFEDNENRYTAVFLQVGKEFYDDNPWDYYTFGYKSKIKED